MIFNAFGRFLSLAFVPEGTTWWGGRTSVEARSRHYLQPGSTGRSAELGGSPAGQVDLVGQLEQRGQRRSHDHNGEQGIQKAAGSGQRARFFQARRHPSVKLHPSRRSDKIFRFHQSVLRQGLLKHKPGSPRGSHLKNSIGGAAREGVLVFLGNLHRFYRPPPDHSEDQGTRKQDEEEKKNNLGSFHCTDRDPGKSQGSGDRGNDLRKSSPIKHDVPPGQIQGDGSFQDQRGNLNLKRRSEINSGGIQFPESVGVHCCCNSRKQGGKSILAQMPILKWSESTIREGQRHREEGGDFLKNQVAVLFPGLSPKKAGPRTTLPTGFDDQGFIGGGGASSPGPPGPKDRCPAGGPKEAGGWLPSDRKQRKP